MKRGEEKLKTAFSQDVWRRARLARRVCRRLRRSGRRRVDDNPTGIRTGSLLRL